MTNPEILEQSTELRESILGALNALYEGTQELPPGEARQLVAQRLGTEDADLDSVQAALRRSLAPWGLDIHDDFSERMGTSYFEAHQLVQQAVELIQQYPWLVFNQGDRRLSAFTLDCMAGNHLFDDFPLLYGISKMEGHIIREAIENVEGIPLSNEDFYTAHYRAMNELLGLDLPHRFY